MNKRIAHTIVTRSPPPTQEELDTEARAWGYYDWDTFLRVQEVQEAANLEYLIHRGFSDDLLEE